MKNIQRYCLMQTIHYWIFDACEKEALKKTFEAYNCPLRDDMKKRYMEINHALWKSYEKGEISREEVIYTALENCLKNLVFL